MCKQKCIFFLIFFFLTACGGDKRGSTRVSLLEFSSSSSTEGVSCSGDVVLSELEGSLVVFVELSIFLRDEQGKEFFLQLEGDELEPFLGFSSIAPFQQLETSVSIDLKSSMIELPASGVMVLIGQDKGDAVQFSGSVNC